MVTRIFLGGASWLATAQGCGGGVGGQSHAWGPSLGHIWQPQSDPRRVVPGLVLSAAAGGMPQRSRTSRNVSLACSHRSARRCLPGQDLAGSQVAKEPEKYGLQSVSLSMIERRLTAFFASLPSCVGLY